MNIKITKYTCKKNRLGFDRDKPKYHDIRSLIKNVVWQQLAR